MNGHEIVVDSFAGGGGASVGIEMALGRSPDIAINHDPEAIAMHMANHPTSRHYQSSVWDVDPVEACGGRPVGLMWLSPDCTFHSKARGAKPFRERDPARRRRGLAWVAVRWAKAVRPRVIALENVEEFADWGPLADDGRPCPLRRGLTFRRFVKQLQNCGYEVDWQELRACDYGAPTTRKRIMPIRAEMRSRYPADWKLRRRFVCFVRARGRCEWCGAEHGKPHPITGSTVVLTTAHVHDHRPEAASLLNLAALCQRCHNQHDAALRRWGRIERARIAAGQKDFYDLD